MEQSGDYDFAGGKAATEHVQHATPQQRDNCFTHPQHIGGLQNELSLLCHCLKAGDDDVQPKDCSQEIQRIGLLFRWTVAPSVNCILVPCNKNVVGTCCLHFLDRSRQSGVSNNYYAYNIKFNLKPFSKFGDEPCRLTDQQSQSPSCSFILWTSCKGHRQLNYTLAHSEGA